MSQQHVQWKRRVKSTMEMDRVFAGKQSHSIACSFGRWFVRLLARSLVCSLACSFHHRSRCLRTIFTWWRIANSQFFLLTLSFSRFRSEHSPTLLHTQHISISICFALYMLLLNLSHSLSSWTHSTIFTKQKRNCETNRIHAKWMYALVCVCVCALCSACFGSFHSSWLNCWFLLP